MKTEFQMEQVYEFKKFFTEILTYEQLENEFLSKKDECILNARQAKVFELAILLLEKAVVDFALDDKTSQSDWADKLLGNTEE